MQMVGFPTGRCDKNVGKRNTGKGKGKAGFIGKWWTTGKLGHRQDQCRIRIENVDEENCEAKGKGSGCRTGRLVSSASGLYTFGHLCTVRYFLGYSRTGP